ncbi:MAG: hypothetical protein ACO1PB_15420 [Ramlibacter sp.]
MRTRPTRGERLLLAFCGCLLLAALALPPLAQPASFHAFADDRTLWGLPNALDVLSNLPFALAGIAGLLVLRRVHVMELSGVQRRCAALFFTGLVVTAGVSGWYHLRPDDLGLAFDRAGMALAFAGLLGLAVAAHVGDRAGSLFARALVPLAAASILAWYFTGNLLPWALLQGGGMVLLVVLACRRPRPGEIEVRWWLVLAAYAVAKLFEAGDAAIHAATGELLSGHTLKHLMAAAAAWPVIGALRRLRCGHNARQEAAHRPAVRGTGCA